MTSKAKRRPTFKQWACPKCPLAYDGPIGVLMVACVGPPTKRHPQVEMKPVE